MFTTSMCLHALQTSGYAPGQTVDDALVHLLPDPGSEHK